MALYVGGMGARSKNFYNDTFARYGFEKEARTIQELYLAGRKDAAEAAIPQSFVDATTLIGPREFVRDRLAALVASGVTALNVSFVGSDRDERIRNCERLRDLVDSM
jgi:hypothetical protein